jgi:sec-independent protein translocase protein TatC
MKALRPIGHEDRLSIVDHLDELRVRLFVCAAVMLAAFCVCFWQNQPLIHVLNRALPSEEFAAQHSELAGQPKQAASEHHAFQQIENGASAAVRALQGANNLPAGLRQGLQSIATGAAEAVRATPKNASTKEKPLVIGLGESFTTTLVVVGYFSLLISLPLILYQLYAFIIPALSKHERRVAVPVMLAAPALFIVGVLFTYYEILPPAVHFLQGYNSSEFQIIPQASSFYKFEIFLMLGIGLAFQVPLLLLGLQKAGAINSNTLTGNWRYAVVLIAVIAAALPGVDPVTMLFETLPLVLLYLASILMLKIVDHRNAKREAAEAAALAQQFDAP